ncbi:MAG: toll/interleukin-1 receptor domain-containing protein [Planctomycetota bacterium]|nr:toll/interleukin-1 receptor domain-containing protein [Planctomycetota bacterium]
MTKKHVFLSYCRDNQDEISKLRDDLITAGESVWWDQDILGGQDWKMGIRAAMRDAYAVAVCLSQETSERILSGVYPEVLDAIAAYREHASGGIFLIPVRLSKCEIPLIEIDGTRTLDRLNHIDLFEANGLNKLIQSIRASSLHPLAVSSQREAVAGKIQPTFRIVGKEAQPPLIRPLLMDLEREISSGDLKDSELARDVFETLEEDKRLKPNVPFDSNWCIRGIQISDDYFTRIQLSAGQRDWQRDFAKVATPILVGVTWSLKRSPDAQVTIIRLCGVIAAKLRLELAWPSDADQSNDIKNAIYQACLNAGELECDDVLIELQGLTVTGPV